MLPTTIKEVLTELEAIGEETARQNNCLAYFNQVYYRTTQNVARAITAEEFENNQRMADFDVAFANMYIEAYREYQATGKCSQVWRRCFELSSKPLCIIQHILIGMSAHINHDLGITSARFCPTYNDLRDFQRDFLQINEILKVSINDMQNSLSKVSPLFFLVDWIGRRTDEKVIDFSMRYARGQAWDLAQEIHSSNSVSEQQQIRDRNDRKFARFADKLAFPKGFLLRNTLRVVRLSESKNVERAIGRM